MKSPEKKLQSREREKIAVAREKKKLQSRERRKNCNCGRGKILRREKKYEVEYSIKLTFMVKKIILTNMVIIF